MKTRQNHIVITGGASGLGLELVHILQETCRVSVISRPSAGLDRLRTLYPELQIVEADLADLSMVEAAAKKLIDQGDEIDLLINNAAIQNTPRFIDADFDPATIMQEINVNFTAICMLIYRLLPALQHSRPATILNINSGLALVPKTSSAVYCATKGALNIFSKSLSHQLDGTNISVRQVFLPLIDTAMTAGRGKGKLPAGEVARSIVNQIHSGQEDIYIGKAKLLPSLHRFVPQLAQRIMKAA